MHNNLTEIALFAAAAAVLIMSIVLALTMPDGSPEKPYIPKQKNKQPQTPNSKQPWPKCFKTTKDN